MRLFNCVMIDICSCTLSSVGGGILLNDAFFFIYFLHVAALFLIVN